MKVVKVYGALKKQLGGQGTFELDVNTPAEAIKALTANFKGLAKWMVTNPSILGAVDTLNMWGLTIIGLSLLFGLFSRWGAIAGASLICLYYLFHPPLVGLEYSKPPEGSYLIIDKNLSQL